MENEGRTPLLDESQCFQPATIAIGRREERIRGSDDAFTDDQCSQDSNSSKELLLEQNEVRKWGMKLNTREVVEEIKKQLTLALPMVVVSISYTGVVVVPLTFVGQLGKLELASASLANSLAFVFGLYIMYGMASALETLCGQAYGAERYHMLEIYLQKAIFVLSCICVPITILNLSIERLLLLVGQAPEISAMSAAYVACLIPMIYANAVLQPLVKFLQAQSIVKPMAYCGVANLALHVGLCWLAVYPLGLGYLGGAVATSISSWLNVLFLIIYIKWTNCCEKTLVYGFCKEAFTDLGSFLELGLPSTVMTCLEGWSPETMLLTAGMLAKPQLELSALSICFTTKFLNYMIPLGLGAAASIRVSNELGAGRAVAARRAVFVVVTMSFLQSLFFSITFYLARRNWASMFSNDRQVVDYVATIMPFVSIVCILDGLQGVLVGVIRGAGWQRFAAVVDLVALYCVGLPFGVVSALVLGWAAKGLLTGLLLGMGSQAIMYGIFTLRTNWEQQAQAVHDREIQARTPKVEIVSI